MTDIHAQTSAPTLPWRLATLAGFGFTIFGVMMSFASIPMESGYDVARENAKAVLMGPLLGWAGITSVLGGVEPSIFTGVISFIILFGPALLMLLRCRTRLGFWTLTTAHILAVVLASVAFINVCKNP